MGPLCNKPQREGITKHVAKWNRDVSRGGSFRKWPISRYPVSVWRREQQVDGGAGSHRCCCTAQGSQPAVSLHVHSWNPPELTSPTVPTLIWSTCYMHLESITTVTEYIWTPSVWDCSGIWTHRTEPDLFVDNWCESLPAAYADVTFIICILEMKCKYCKKVVKKS